MGESIRKMALIPMDQHLKQAPVLHQLNQLDAEMKHIVDSAMPADMKFKLYNHVLHQHSAIGEELKKPLKIELKAEQPPIKTFNRAMAMMGLPKSSHSSAQLLADHIERNPEDIRFNEKEELIVDGSAVKGSNARDLFSFASRNTGLNPPLGWMEFRAALDQTHIPAAAIMNKKWKGGWVAGAAAATPAIYNRNIQDNDPVLAQALRTPLPAILRSPLRPRRLPPHSRIPRPSVTKKKKKKNRHTSQKGSGVVGKIPWEALYK